MTEIAFIGFDSNKMIAYYPNGDKKVEYYPYDSKSDKDVTIQVKNESIIFLKEIYDPTTFKEIGLLRISFDNKGIANLEGNYGHSKLFVYADNGDVAFGEENKEWIEELKADKKLSALEKEYHIYTHRARTRELNVVSYVEKIQTGKIPFVIWVMLIFMGIGLFSIGMYFVNRRILRLSNRLERIVNGMERVMEGDLSVRLDVKKEDELDIIADNFNIMCENLDTYIQKSYLAEIEQKNAEMNALQSQINPHFLYNTLEAIRMKAICNGDKEVGKMLYGLAVVFRSQVKDDNVVNVARELYYCKKYLEIFEFRYQNKFEFAIDCPEEYMDIPVIKFIVQPIIENYFAHGIRLQEEDNKLEIIVEKEEDVLFIHVKDNGIGMTEDEISEKKLELKEKVRTRESIGILNVHRRIVTTYGEGYGVDLKKNGTQGLCVTLSIPIRKGESEHV